MSSPLNSQHARIISRSNGFTLIEVMIAVAVVAILSMIAVPSYRDYVIRGNIPEATSRLATKQVQMEQFFQDNRTYVGGPACASDTTASRYFDFSCPTSGTGTPSTTVYTIRAVGKASMAGFTFTIDQAGSKATTAVPTGWATSTTCWVSRKGGAC